MNEKQSAVMESCNSNSDITRYLEELDLATKQMRSALESVRHAASKGELAAKVTEHEASKSAQQVEDGDVKKLKIYGIVTFSSQSSPTADVVVKEESDKFGDECVTYIGYIYVVEDIKRTISTTKKAIETLQSKTSSPPEVIASKAAKSIAKIKEAIDSAEKSLLDKTMIVCCLECIAASNWNAPEYGDIDPDKYRQIQVPQAIEQYAPVDTKGMTVGVVPIPLPEKQKTDLASVDVAEGSPHKKRKKDAKKALEDGVTLDMNRWYVHNLGREEVTLSEVQQQQSIYILRCIGTTINIGTSAIVNGQRQYTPEKLVHLALEECEDVVVRFPGVITSVELYHCESMKVTCYKMVSTIQIDNTAGCKLIFQTAETADNVCIFHCLSRDLEMYRFEHVQEGKPAKILKLPIPDSCTLDMHTGSRQLSLAKEKQFLTRMKDGKLETTDVAELKGKEGYVVLPENDIHYNPP